MQLLTVMLPPSAGGSQALTPSAEEPSSAIGDAKAGTFDALLHKEGTSSQQSATSSGQAGPLSETAVHSARPLILAEDAQLLGQQNNADLPPHIRDHAVPFMPSGPTTSSAASGSASPLQGTQPLPEQADSGHRTERPAPVPGVTDFKPSPTPAAGPAPEPAGTSTGRHTTAQAATAQPAQQEPMPLVTDGIRQGLTSTPNAQGQFPQLDTEFPVQGEPVMPGKQGTRAAVQPRSQGFHASSATLASQADSGQAGKEAGALGLTALGTQSGGSHLSHQGASHQGSGGFGSSDEQSPTSVARQSQGGTAVAAEQSQGQAQPIFSASQASAGSAIHQGHSLMPPAVQALPASSTPVVTIPQETPFPQPVQAVHLEVHPPHLGEVHLRVVLANQTVHTHVTLEHSELGQTLLARQGHLENALNASGLDLGQFRVLIDRHGSGQAGQEWATDAQHHRGQQDESDRESSLPGEKQEIWMNEVEQRRHINLVA